MTSLFASPTTRLVAAPDTRTCVRNQPLHMFDCPPQCLGRRCDNEVQNNAEPGSTFYQTGLNRDHRVFISVMSEGDLKRHRGGSV